MGVAICALASGFGQFGVVAALGDVSKAFGQTTHGATLADEAGLSLIHMALAFVANHPAVTSPIIGPRTMEQLESQLGAADVTLSAELLDRIDEVVPPGVTLLQEDEGYLPPALTEAALRRR